MLHDLGFAIAAYPLTLLSAGLKAQEAALQSLKQKDQVESGAPAILKALALEAVGLQPKLRARKKKITLPRNFKKVT